MWPTELKLLRQSDIIQRLVFAQARGQMLRKIPLSQTCGCLSTKAELCIYLNQIHRKMPFSLNLKSGANSGTRKVPQPYLSWTELLSKRVFKVAPAQAAKPHAGFVCDSGSPLPQASASWPFWLQDTRSLKAASALSAPVARYTPYTPLSHTGGRQIISSQIMFIMHQPDQAKQLTWESVPWDVAAISFQAGTSKSLTHLPGGLQTCAWRTQPHPLTERESNIF